MLSIIVKRTAFKKIRESWAMMGRNGLLGRDVDMRYLRTPVLACLVEWRALILSWKVQVKFWLDLFLGVLGK